MSETGGGERRGPGRGEAAQGGRPARCDGKQGRRREEEEPGRRRTALAGPGEKETGQAAERKGVGQPKRRFRGFYDFLNFVILGFGFS